MQKMATTPEIKQKTSAYRPEFSMGLLDYNRYDELLKVADSLDFRTLNDDLNALKPFLAILRVVYGNFKSLIFSTEQEKFKNKLKKIQVDFEDWSKQPKPIKFPVTLAEDLHSFYEDLLLIKQLSGLGQPVIREESHKTKMDRAAGFEKIEAHI